MLLFHNGVAIINPHAQRITATSINNHKTRSENVLITRPHTPTPTPTLLRGLLKLCQVNLVPQQPTNPTKPPTKLAPLLTLVGDELQRTAKLFVVGRQPLEEGLLVLHLQLNAGVLVLVVRAVALRLLGQQFDLCLACGNGDAGACAAC